MRSFVAVVLAAGLAAACSSSPDPDMPEARADGTPVAKPSAAAPASADVQRPAPDPHEGGAGNPHGGAMGGSPHGSGGPRADDVPVAKVERAPAPDGRTVAEVHAGKKQLHDKPVAVRGTVVKFLSGIMGRNWVHLRDGSGTAENGDHDLTVTTNDTVQVGSVVLARGIVRAEKDFGSGYAYGVIMEEARLTPEPR